MKLPDVDLVDAASGRFLIFQTDVGIGNALRVKGAFEPHLAKIASLVHRLRGGGMLLDIGANIGSFCVPVARATGCEVHAFEAQRLVAQLLSGNLVLNGIGAGHVHHVALAAPNCSGSLQIEVPNYASAGNFGAFSTQEHLFQSVSRLRMKTSDQKEEVPLRTLDSYNFDDVFLLKIDVEGAELQVLQGAVETLRESNFPPLIFEAWREEWWASEREQLLSFVQDLGYEVTPMDENFFAQHVDTPPEERVQIRVGPGAD